MVRLTVELFLDLCIGEGIAVWLLVAGATAATISAGVATGKALDDAGINILKG